MKLTIRERFLSKVCRNTENGCWEWKGPLLPDGYGVTRLAGKRHFAHRVAWMLFRSEIPPRLVVCHTCDVRACVNPAHLFLGTAAENSKDMIEKGRSARGEKHGSAKLTADKVSRIRVMLAEGRMHMSEIAREFGVSNTAVWAIKIGKTWRHV
jgi:HNH endonuclease